MCIPGTHSAQKPYVFSPFLERKRKVRKKLYLPRVKYIVTSNPVVYITALKTLKESKNIYIYNTTIWSSEANCTEIRQTLNESLSKANSWFLCVKFVHWCVNGNTGPYCCTQGAGGLSEFLCPIPRGV